MSRGQDPPPDYKSKTLKEWIEILKTPDDYPIRQQARQALGPDGPYAKVAVPALIEAFADKQPPEDWAIVEVIMETITDYGPSVVPQLVQALKRPEAPVRAAAADALGRVRPKPVDAVPVLVDAIKDSSPNVRLAAVWSLGSIRRPLDKIIPALVTALCDDKDRIREVAAESLGQMGRKSKSALPALIVALGDKNYSVREKAAWAIRYIGPDARAAVPVLIEGIRNKNKDSNRATFAQAIGGIGPDAKDAVPVLIEALQEKDPKIRSAVTVALGEIGPGAKAAVPALISAASDNTETWMAFEAIGKIGPEAQAAIPMLIESLAKGGRYPTYRCYVARALGGIGPAAKEAVPLLAKVARNQLEGVDIDDLPSRQAASEAVMKIDPEYGTKHGIELAYLDLRLRTIPSVKLAPRAALTEEKKNRIKQLIADLAGVSDPDAGLSSTITGHAFAPLPDREQFSTGLVTDHRLKPSATLRNLVEFGPDALPFLLESLDDKTPTKLKVETVAMTFFGDELDGNPLNSLERHVQTENAKRKDEDDDDDNSPYNYTLRVGDICFVVIGQIVGRQYSAVRYQPTRMVIVNSPVEDKVFRDRVRAIWSSNDPAQKLLDSLLIDYSTEGIANGKSARGLFEASNRQVEAIVRLLYYYPREMAPLIAERLKRMDVRKRKPDEDWRIRQAADGVDMIDFLKAIIWSKEPSVRAAIFDIFERTDDAHIAAAVLPSVKETHADRIVPRLRTMLGTLPETEHSARGYGYDLLLALGEYAGKDAKPDFESYLRNASLQRQWTVCWVLQETHSEWALEFLTPMLSDKRTGYASKSYRLCDMAASTLSEIHTDLTFKPSETSDERDRQIEHMRRQIAKKASNSCPVPFCANTSAVRIVQ